jgi:hypothetical protein
LVERPWTNNYAGAIARVFGSVVLLKSMVAYVLTWPTDPLVNQP